MTFAQKMRIGMEIANVKTKEMALDLHMCRNSISLYRTGNWEPSIRRKAKILEYLEFKRNGTLEHLKRIEIDEPHNQKGDTVHGKSM